MAKEYSRTERVADFLQQELASLIQRELRDPRLSLTSVTGVDVSRDLSHAKVYVTFMGKDDPEQAADGVEALNKASGYLRSLVAKGHNARTTPKLRFYFDESISRGQHLSALIEGAIASDERNTKNTDPVDGDPQ